MGPLSGVRVLEIASLAPGPFACMMLSDMGADVLRVDRPDRTGLSSSPGNPLNRGRRSVTVDLKHPGAADVIVALAARADVLVEGFRPGVAERLGIGPEQCCAVNRRLVYARMTGWGQQGPLAAKAGHDINYVALSGALHPIGPAGQPPTPPINYVGDFGGGGMLLTVGILAALVERSVSGTGQVVDAAMVDGAALLAAHLRGLQAVKLWQHERGHNLLDGGAPFYATYETADGGFVAVGAIEPEFFADLVDALGLPSQLPREQFDRDAWPRHRTLIAARFRSRTRDDWMTVFEHRDACVAPVLTLAEAPDHPHNRARDSYVSLDDRVHPAPAPRFSRTPSRVASAPREPGSDNDAAWDVWHVPAAAVARWKAVGAVG